MTKKIYITSLHMLHGGVEMSISLLANALVKRAYDVEILCVYNLGEPVYEIDERVTITYLTNVHPNKEEIAKAIHSMNPFAMLREALYAIKVLRLKRKSMVDIFKRIREGVIISTRNEHTLLLSKYGNDEVKKIAQLHHDHRFDKRLLKDFAEGYENIDVFLLLTDELRQEVSEVMIKNQKTEILTMPNFLKSVDSAKKFKEKRERQVVAVGRLHEVKGFARMIRIWSNVCREDDVVLKIVGDGEQREPLEKIIADCKLEDKVVLVGALRHDDVLLEMSKSLMYLMTSYTEGFPFVLIEAMSEGLPVISYDVRVGPRAIIQDGINGYLVREDEEIDFVNRVQELLNDEKRRVQMSQKAIERANEFTEDIIMERWEEVIR